MTSLCILYRPASPNFGAYSDLNDLVIVSPQLLAGKTIFEHVNAVSVRKVWFRKAKMLRDTFVVLVQFVALRMLVSNVESSL